MSHYPQPPYQPPQQMGYQTPHGADPYAQVMGPCRRTSVLMFVFAALLLLMGGCIAGMLWVPGMEQTMAPQMAALPPGTTFEGVRDQFTVAGTVIAGVAVLMVILGGFVRGGSKPAIVSSIVLTCLVIAWLVLQIIGALAVGASQGLGPQATMGACILLVLLALTIWLVVWLFQAGGAANGLRAWQRHHAQNPQAYQQNHPSQQPQVWQQPGPGQWPGQQNWPPPPPPPPAGPT